MLKVQNKPAKKQAKYSYDETLEASSKYFREKLPATVWADKYAMRDAENNLLELTPDDMHDRLAGEFARVDAEKYGLDYDVRFKLYREAMHQFSRVVPQGSPMCAIGNTQQIMSASNCVVVESPEDSIAGIMKTGTELAQLYKRRCGVGVDISTLRPDGFKVNNAARTTSGAWSFADFFSYITRMIGQSGRRGALMITLDVHHPDVVKFATMKADLTKVTGANVSIRLSDAFLKAVDEDTDYEQYWPMEGPKQISKMVKAREVWKTIIDTATKTAEPGLIFWDRMTQYLPANSYKQFRSRSTNPCVTADTWVLTEKGPRQVKELIGQPFTAIVNGQKAPSTEKGFFSTGVKNVYRLKTKEGFTLDCTADHPLRKVTKLTRYKKTTEWTKLADLVVGDQIDIQHHPANSWSGEGSFEEGWLLGSLVGDGVFTKSKAQLSFWGPTKEVMHQNAVEKIKASIGARSDLGKVCGTYSQETHDRLNVGSTNLLALASRWGVEQDKKFGAVLEKASSAFTIGFLQAWFDADGSPQGEQEKGLSVRLSSIHLESLQRAQRMLARLGIISTIYPFRKEAGFRSLPDGQGGSKDYWCEANHELVIACENLVVFAELIGFSDPVQQSKLLDKISHYKRAVNRERFVATIESMTSIGEQEVYDCTIPTLSEFDANGISVHNCSEISLSAYDSCRLISLNLTGYVRDAFTKPVFDWDLFKSDIKLATQMCDNLVDLELELIDKIKLVCDGDEEKALWQKLWQAGHDGRRTGLGTHGVGDALAQLNVKYDSDEALDWVDRIYQTLCHTSYETSTELAKARGPFPVWDWNVDKDNKFIQSLPKSLQDKIKANGRRNIAMLTQAPTGSVSIVSKCGEFARWNVSSGVEPVFRNFYIRKKKINPNDKARVDYKDALGDTWQEYPVFHPNIKNYLEKVRGYTLDVPDDQLEAATIQKLKDEKLPDFFVTSDQIDWKYRVKLQGAEQAYIDHSISSTINLPKGTTSDVVGGIYLEGWKNNLKGITVYVEASRDGVLVTESTKKIDPTTRPEKIIIMSAPKRPKMLPCEIHQVTVDGRRWTVMVGLLGGTPYEVFLGYSEQLQLPAKHKAGSLMKTGKGKYQLHVGEGDDELVIKDVISVFNNPQSAWATRLLSMSLRHGTPVEYVVDTLSKDGKINDINRVIARVLKKYIPEGGKVTISTSCQFCKGTNLRYQEGCIFCVDCGLSPKCS